MQKTKGEPSFQRARRDAFSDKCSRSQMEQQITQGLVSNTQPTRGAAEGETVHQSMCKV